MPNAKPPAVQTGIPEGYAAIPILAAEAAATVRLCALAKATADPVTGHLVMLRDLPDATVYLGCLTDAGGRVREWVELWVQNVDGLLTSLPALTESISNNAVDERWNVTVTSLRDLNPDAFIQTGWESEPAPPTFLDLKQQSPFQPGAPEAPWQLCRDDAALRGAGLPAYATSLFRYLFQPSDTGNGFVPVVAGAPTNPNTRPPVEALKISAGQVPLNPQGGRMLAMKFSPIDYEDYVDLLGGKAWKGFEHGKKPFNFNGVYRTLNDWSQMQQGGSHLFLGGQGKAGRFIEAFHLKLQLFFQALSSVRTFVERHQLPFLNLAPDSFRVGLNELGAQLPFLWTAGAMLVKPSQAYALPVETSNFRFFVRAGQGGASVYQPETLNSAVQGSGSVRLRKVLPPDQGRTSLEGTLVTSDRINVSPHDLLWIRLPLPGGRVDLYGHLYTTDGLAEGEARFRTLPQVMAPDVDKGLRAAEGISFAKSPYEVVPLLSSPCDLYSLGVLAVRTFLVNPQNTLAVALDEVLSLAKQVATEHNAETPIHTRVGSIISSDVRFTKSLAPHRLSQEPMEPSAAFELLPPELWNHLLAFIVRLFPGMGPDSYARDFGDAPALSLETAFNKPLEDLEKIFVQSRSLIVIDWNANREVHSAIRDLLDRNRA